MFYVSSTPEFPYSLKYQLICKKNIDTPGNFVRIHMYELWCWVKINLYYSILQHEFLLKKIYFHDLKGLKFLRGDYQAPAILQSWKMLIFLNFNSCFLWNISTLIFHTAMALQQDQFFYFCQTFKKL